MLTQPSWICFTDQEKQTIQYTWDDKREWQNVTGDAPPVLGAATQMSLRAGIVLCLGLYEWIVWRFEGLHRRAEPLQIAQVGWCVTVDPSYMVFFELDDRSKWPGPIEGPLRSATSCLHFAMSEWHRSPDNVYGTIPDLTQLAMHVVPDVDRFEAWLKIILDRLIQTFPLVPEDPFEDLFGHRVAQRFGPLIGRSVLDPTTEYMPPEGRDFLAQMFREAQAEENPFLASPSYLKEFTSFYGEPYVIPGTSS
jgi:hypothetical protein